MGIPQSDARMDFYGIGSIPASVFNGTEKEIGASADIYEQYEQRLLERWTNRSSLKLNLTNSISNDTLFSRLTIIPVDSVPFDTLLLQFALFEDSIYFKAPNGENLHRFVVRALLTPEVLSLARGDTTIRTCAISISNQWQRNRLGLAAFLQDPKTGKIVQAKQLLGIENYNFTLIVPESLKVSKLDSIAIFPFTIKNIGLLGDTIVLDLPDSLANLPLGWSSSICDTLTCFLLPFKVYLEPAGIAESYRVDVTPSVTTGTGSLALVVKSKGNPNLVRAQRLVVQVP